jgi:outer membrane cobalamin receptor
MKYAATLVLISLIALQVQAQSLVKGIVKDKKGEGIPGVNVYLKDTYDGASTGVDGSFSFSTDETATQVLVVSHLSYQKHEVVVSLPAGKALEVILAEQFNKLGNVVVTAEAFAASTDKIATVMKPLDIVTTAGATGDIVGSLTMMPGTQKNGESGRLFVRGGDSRETRIFIDGMWVQNAFNATADNLPARGRFSPFMFKGVTLSTGGYSAEYSQALSSALAMQTINFPAESQTDISIMTVGGSLAQTFVGEKQSVTAEVNYTNLKPYFSLIKQNMDWHKAPEALGASATYRYKTSKTGLLKVYGNYSTASLQLYQLDPATLSKRGLVQVGNRYAYLNSTYREALGTNWTMLAGAAFNYSKDDLSFHTNGADRNETGLHLKNTFTYNLSQRVDVHMGGEAFVTNTGFVWRADTLQQTGKVHDKLGGAFAEADIQITQKWSARLGVRGDYSHIQKQFAPAPRASVAYQTGNHSQVSAAYGQFYQQTTADWLMLNPRLQFEQADHYIVSYQVNQDSRAFRAELYHKEYKDLIRFNAPVSQEVSLVNNEGFGYARGLDLFWRDRKSIKGVDYWVSYSFLDSRRLYQHYPAEAVPTFASKHNLSVVVKYFVPKLKTQLGASFAYASPRPYHNPNEEGFNAQRTPAFKDLSLNASYLYRQNIIFHLSATNVLGTDNVFGYRYAQQADSEGAFRREPIRQGAPRFLFAGVFFTLSKDKSKNMLNNL